MIAVSPPTQAERQGRDTLDVDTSLFLHRAALAAERSSPSSPVPDRFSSPHPSQGSPRHRRSVVLRV